MFKRIIAIAFIFVVTALAWVVLGQSIFNRTNSSGNSLKPGVVGLWGDVQVQKPPSSRYLVRDSGSSVLPADLMQVAAREPLVLAGSQIVTDIDLKHRQKGLLWYATYSVKFHSTYRYHNDTGKPIDLLIDFAFPNKKAVYDNFVFRLRDKEWLSGPLSREGVVTGALHLEPGESAHLEVGYRSQGMDSWRYQFGPSTGEVRNFKLEMNTNFRGIDYPADGLAPGVAEKTEKGWRLVWDYQHLISGTGIGLLMPQKLQPGPLAGQIAMFAPISLLFFMIVMFVIGIIKRIDIHPMHFAFISAGFFAFHLLLAYLADQVAFATAFVISSVVSVFLVVSYLRLIFGNGFAFGYAGLSQFVFLVLFSYAFFYKGMTGLTISIGAIVLLFILMQVTAKVDWGRLFSADAQPSDMNLVAEQQIAS